MRNLEKLADAKNSVAGRILAAFMAFLLAFSMVNLTVFADEAEALSGERFKIHVYRAYDDGTVVSDAWVVGNCADSCGGSGYNHSMNVNKVISASGISVPSGAKVIVKQYDGWWSSNSVTYDPFYTWKEYDRLIHYNITGSAPYKANESVWVVTAKPVTEYTVTVNGSSPISVGSF